MMLNSIELTKERKIILIGGAILLILGAIYRFYPVIMSSVSVSDEIAMKRNYIEKYLRVAGQRKQALSENNYYKRRFKQMEDRLLTGATPTLAAVEVQKILNNISAVNDIKFVSMRVMKPKADEKSDYVRLPIQFSMNSDINQLKEMLYGIESSSELLLITQLDAKIARSKSRDRQLIRSTIIVEGVMKVPQQKT